jgi:hypothetical protein
MLYVGIITKTSNTDIRAYVMGNGARWDGQIYTDLNICGVQMLVLKEYQDYVVNIVCAI